MAHSASDSVVRIRRVLTLTDVDVGGLVHVLIDCVDAGASVSFMSPLAAPKARAFWQRVAEGVSRSERALLVAECIFQWMVVADYSGIVNADPSGT